MKHDDNTKLPRYVQAHLNVASAPRNAHAIHNDGQGRNRARAIPIKYTNTHVLFVDSKIRGPAPKIETVTDA